MTRSLPVEKRNGLFAGDFTLERRLQGMLGGLSGQFLLGLALATVAGYDASTHTGNHVIYLILLTLHMVVALGLVAGAITLVLAIRKQASNLRNMAWIGLAAILVSTGTGLARLAVDGEWLTFLMGTGFVVAIAIYGQLLGEVLRHSKRQS